jgi:hypothetical protein
MTVDVDGWVEWHDPAWLRARLEVPPAENAALRDEIARLRSARVSRTAAMAGRTCRCR